MTREPSTFQYLNLLSTRDKVAAKQMLQKEMEEKISANEYEAHINPSAIQVSVQQGDNPPVEVHAGKKGPETHAPEIDKDTAMHIASMTKVFTSAALIKLWDLELAKKNEGVLEKEYFSDGMETKLSTFMESLKGKFPKARASLEKMETYEHFEHVTLRDLLQHTHGFGEKDARKTREEQIADPTKIYSCAEIVADLVRNPEKDQYGKMCYGATGTNLSGMIMELVTGKEYDQALKDLIITPLELKNTHTLSEATALYREGNAARAFSWTSKEKLQYEHNAEIPKSGAIDNNCSSNGRADASLKSCPDDCHKFIRSYLSQDPNVSMFTNQKVMNTLAPENRKKTMDGNDYDYGVAPFKDWKTDPPTVLGYGHNGDGTGFGTNFCYNPETDTSFYYGVAGENLSDGLAFEIAAGKNPEKLEQKTLDYNQDIKPIRDGLLTTYSFEAMRDNPELVVKTEVSKSETQEYKKPIGVAIASADSTSITPPQTPTATVQTTQITK